jgi:hypothetical protein
MESFADPIGLWRFGLGLGVVNVIDRQIQLVIMGFSFATVFRDDHIKGTSRRKAKCDLV